MSGALAFQRRIFYDGFVQSMQLQKSNRAYFRKAKNECTYRNECKSAWVLEVAPYVSPINESEAWIYECELWKAHENATSTVEQNVCKYKIRKRPIDIYTNICLYIYTILWILYESMRVSEYRRACYLYWGCGCRCYCYLATVHRRCSRSCHIESIIQCKCNDGVTVHTSCYVTLSSLLTQHEQWLYQYSTAIVWSLLSTLDQVKPSKVQRTFSVLSKCLIRTFCDSKTIFFKNIYEH